MHSRYLTKNNTRSAMRIARDTLTLLIVGLLTMAGSCDDKKIRKALKGDAATSGTVLSAVSQVSSNGTSGTAFPGGQPEGTASQFDLTLVPSAAAVTNGGTALINATAASAFTHVYVAVEGLDAYYEIVLPAAVTSTDLLLTVDQDYSDPTITFAVSAGDGTLTGAIATQAYDVVIVGTGDVQVSLTFDRQDDVDLWVIDPAGDTVWWAQRTVPSGGELDLDANPACFEPHGNSENITWPEGSAPTGTYEVYVQLFESCSNQDVNFTVTVTVIGSPPQIFRGQLTPADELVDPPLLTSFTVLPPAAAL
jgi:hypothetical protein